MLIELLVAASLVAPFECPAQEPQHGISAAANQEVNNPDMLVDVSDLSGSKELKELRQAILRDDLPRSVRAASLDRYTKLLKDNASDRKVENLVATIRQYVEPKSPSFSVSAASDSDLSLRASPAQMDWVERYLEGMRSATDSQLLIETVIYEGPEGSRVELLGDRSGLALTEAEAEALKLKIGAFDHYDLMNTPSVLVNPGALATLSALNETAYVSDFTLTVMPDMEQELADPVVSVIQEGTSMRISSLPMGAEELNVHVDFESVTLRRPIAESSRKIGAAGATVTIQVPETTKVQANARFSLKEDGVIVLGATNPGFEGDDARDTIVFIRARRVESLAPAEDSK